jgi:hypothetical protein
MPDIREFWLWYERSWPTRGGRATRPRVTLSDIQQEPALSARERTAAQVLCIVAAVILVIAVVWGLLH